MTGDYAVDRLITRTWAPGDTPLTWYVRPGGDDANTGLSPAPGDAFLTLERALREVSLYATNKPSIIDVTGSTFDVDTLLQLGGTQLGSIIDGFDPNVAPVFPPPPRLRQTQIIATPTEALEVTITATNPDLTTGMVTLTTSTAIAPGQLDDAILVGSGGGEYGPIASYTTGAGPNTIEVAADSTFTGPHVRAYVPGATLTYGDATAERDGAIYLNALSDWNFEWIAFESHAKNSALTIWAHAPVSLFGCVLAGIHLRGGASPVDLTACVIANGSYVQDGGAVAMSRCFVNATLDCNGSSDSGANTCTEVIFDSCVGAWGGGNTCSRFSCEMQKCSVRNAEANGVEALFGNWAMSSCDVSNNGSAGVFLKGATMQFQDVTGTGNGSWGLDAHWLAACISNGASITGGTGDVNLGAAGTLAWTAMPAQDGVQLVTVHQIMS